VSWNSLWTLSFGLSQFNGHGSWLMCEVALSIMYMQFVNLKLITMPNKLKVGLADEFKLP
jgi:hypothetical protein